MDRQKDGYIRKEDLVTGLRSSTSFSLSMYREEFILAGLMVAGFLLYQVCFMCQPAQESSDAFLKGGKAVRTCAGYRRVRRTHRDMSHLSNRQELLTTASKYSMLVSPIH